MAKGWRTSRASRGGDGGLPRVPMVLSTSSLRRGQGPHHDVVASSQPNRPRTKPSDSSSVSGSTCTVDSSVSSITHETQQQGIVQPLGGNVDLFVRLGLLPSYVDNNERHSSSNERMSGDITFSSGSDIDINRQTQFPSLNLVGSAASTVKSDDSTVITSASSCVLHKSRPRRNGRGIDTSTATRNTGKKMNGAKQAEHRYAEERYSLHQQPNQQKTGKMRMGKTRRRNRRRGRKKKHESSPGSGLLSPILPSFYDDFDMPSEFACGTGVSSSDAKSRSSTQKEPKKEEQNNTKYFALRSILADLGKDVVSAFSSIGSECASMKCA
mmetsp:Transcript_2146/g.6209  ORF Transcript_2146/g.6209 Transcript_2146/m.6209 type:complete len:326 (-) Transcript_2146:86-1063(-)